MSNKRKALFLDRDGVINIDHAYVHKKENFDFIKGIFELCQLAVQRDYLIFVVTNQAGIGRGYYTEQQFHELTEWMCTEFSKNKIKIEKVYFCPYHEKHGVGKYKKASPFRKPEPGMILQAEKEFNIDLERSIFIGDKESDMMAGHRAGVGCNILFRESFSKPDVSNKTSSKYIVDSLLDIEKYL